MDQIATRFDVDPVAADLAEQMLERDDVFRDILEETLATADDGETIESGRTVCGTGFNRTLPPIARHFTKVTLPTCPVSIGGTWHTHVTPNQLLNPINSLPDFANVAFGIIDVSIVAGAESSHVVVATEDRRELQRTLREATGVDVRGPDDVVTAVVDGSIEDPPAVRDDLYGRLGGASAYRVDTAMPDLADRIEQTAFRTTLDAPVSLAVEMSGCTLYESYSHHVASHNGRMGRVIEQGRSCQQAVRATAKEAEAGFDLSNQIVGAVIGSIIGTGVDRVLFGG